MTLSPVGEVVVLGALSGELALLTDDAEITDAGRVVVDLRDTAMLVFGPARLDWRVTGLAGYARTGARLFTRGLAMPVDVLAGQMFELDLQATVEMH